MVRERMIRRTVMLAVSAVLAAGCAGATSGGGSPSDATTWPDKIVAEEFIKSEVGASHVVCEPSGDDFTCRDTDFGVCYDVWHTGPADGGTVHGRKVGSC